MKSIPPHTFLLLVVFLAVFPPRESQCQSIVINEFMADNNSAVADQNGEFDDWVELYNMSGAAISLGGYYLTDDDNLTRWAFPDTAIGPNEFMIVWTDDDEGQEGLHAGFKLSASGESVRLVRPDLTIEDEVTFGAQMSDISMGRFPDGTGDFVFMNPTPGGPNDGGPPDIPGDLGYLLFNHDRIHDFHLHFYVTDWEDSLKYNKEHGELYMPAQLTYNTLVLDSIGVRYKGNSSYILSANTPKKPFKFNFNKFIDGTTFFGLDQLNLSNCIEDPSFMREAISYALARRYLPASRTGYANLYVDGELIGFYLIVEQVDETFLRRHFPHNGYNLYKASDNGATLKYRGEDRSGYEGELELKSNEDANDWSRLIAMIDKLNNTPAEDFVSTMRDHLDLDTCIRHLALTMVLSHFDSYTGSGRNFYLYDAQDTNQFNMIPWDMNESFGRYSNNWDVITQDVVEISNLDDRPLNRRIVENDSLRSVYLGYVAEMIQGPAAYDSVAAMADEIKPFIESRVEADPNKFYSYQNFIDNVERDVTVDLGQVIPGIKSFSLARNANLAAQLSRVPVYPGDTDNNGIVDALDVLPIGVHFLEKGTKRSSVSFRWRASYAALWDDSAGTFADADGDGVVDEKDVIAVGVNWGATHDCMTASFEIDPGDEDVIKAHEGDLRRIYDALDGSGESVEDMKALLESVLGIGEKAPAAFSLDQNFPNPFNPSTTIRFSLRAAGRVTLTVYNVAGQVVAVPLRERAHEAGWHTCAFDASKLASGVYLYRISAGDWSATRKMVVLR